jgi:glucan-binding YG repeat protein
MEAKLGQMSSAWQADLEGRAKAKEKVEAQSAAELSSLRAKVEKLEKSIAETRTGAAEMQAAAARLEDENKKLRAALDGATRAQVAAKPDENRKPAAEPEKPAKEVSAVKTLEAAPKTAEKSAPPPEERPAPEASVATAAPEANAAAEAVAGPGIKQWQLPNGSFYFGEKPRVPGSKLVGVVGNMGTSGDR